MAVVAYWYKGMLFHFLKNEKISNPLITMISSKPNLLLIVSIINQFPPYFFPFLKAKKSLFVYKSLQSQLV